MRRIAQIAAFALAIAMVPMVGAQADEIGGTGFSVPVTAPPPPYVELESRQVAAGIGFHWGSGTLSFEGRQHAFSVKGVSAGDLGIAKMIAEGEVQNLASLSQFEGRYVAVEAGVSVGKGASRRVLRNQHGVVIRLAAQLTGATVTLGAEGFEISLR